MSACVSVFTATLDNWIRDVNVAILDIESSLDNGRSHTDTISLRRTLKKIHDDIILPNVSAQYSIFLEKAGHFLFSN